MTINNKYLVNVTDGKNNIERATISMILATSASKENETAMFLTSDASVIALKGGLTGLQYQDMEPMAALLDQYQANGGKIWLCPVCAKVKGITEDDLIPGAELAGAPKTMAYLESGARLLA